MEFNIQDTLEKVIAVIVEKLHIDRATIGNAASFHDLGADSLDMVEIIMRLEEEFGMEINDEDAEKLTTIDEVVTYIHTRRTQ